MTIKEFAEMNDIDISAIYRKINRNKDKLQNHIFITDGKMHIDDFAFNFLLPTKIKMLKKTKYEKTEIEEKYKIEISAYRRKNEKLENEKREVEKKYADALKRIEELEQIISKEKVGFLKKNSFSENK